MYVLVPFIGARRKLERHSYIRTYRRSQLDIRSYVRTPTYVTYNAEEIIMDALSPYVCTHVRTAPN